MVFDKSSSSFAGSPKRLKVLDSRRQKGVVLSKGSGAWAALCGYVDAMKMLSIPPVDPSKWARSQAWLDILGPILAVTLIAIGLWMMPVNVFILLYVLFLGGTFLLEYAAGRAGIRKERGRRAPAGIPSYWSGDSFESPGRPRELHLALKTRSIKEHHAHPHRRF